MATTEIIRERLLESFELYDELAAEVPESALAEKLPGLASNPLGEQLWCVVGARESFARAIEAGEWSGFSCSLSAEETRRRDAVGAALARSATELLGAVDRLGTWDDDRSRLVLRLLEHEAAHHGQLIRYLYGLRLPIPAGWRERYALA
jgi:hypothetical protein